MIDQAAITRAIHRAFSAHSAERYARHTPAKNQGKDLYSRVRSAVQAAMVERYGERWITLKPNGDEGGYAHVKIDDDGNIKVGPEGLANRGIKNLKDFQQPKTQGPPLHTRPKDEPRRPSWMKEPEKPKPSQAVAQPPKESKPKVVKESGPQRFDSLGVTATKDGRRMWLEGNTYAIKGAIGNAGGHWDSELKRWWIGTGANWEKLNQVLAKKNGGPAATSTEKPPQSSPILPAQVAPKTVSSKPVWITGNTYPHRDAIRAAGGKWDGASKSWSIEPDKAERLRKLAGIQFSDDAQKQADAQRARQGEIGKSHPHAAQTSSGADADALIAKHNGTRNGPWSARFKTPEDKAAFNSDFAAMSKAYLEAAAEKQKQDALKSSQQAKQFVESSGRTVRGDGQVKSFTGFVGHGKREQVLKSYDRKAGEIIHRDDGAWMVVDAGAPRFVSDDHIEDNDAWSDHKRGAGWYASYKMVPVEKNQQELAADAVKQNRETSKKRIEQIASAVQKAEHHSDFVTGSAAGMTQIKGFGHSGMAGHRKMYSDGSKIVISESSYDDAGHTWSVEDPAMAKELLEHNATVSEAEKHQSLVDVVRYAIRSELVERYSLRSRIADAVARTHRAPSEAQRLAGNYAKGKFWLWGHELAIENPKGSTRSGTSKSGAAWSVTMGAHYGYIRRTVSKADGDAVDCFIGPHPESEAVFVINQQRENGKFDEHKIVLGCRSEQETKRLYLSCYSPGWRGIQSIVPMTKPQFLRWLEHGDTSRPVKWTDSIERYELSREHAVEQLRRLGVIPNDAAIKSIQSHVARREAKGAGKPVAAEHRLPPVLPPAPEKPAKVAATHTKPQKSTQKPTNGSWQKVGGSSVFVNNDGQITMGCPGLKGEHVSDLIGEEEESRERREARQDHALAQGKTGHDLTASQAKRLGTGKALAPHQLADKAADRVWTTRQSLTRKLTKAIADAINSPVERSEGDDSDLEYTAPSGFDDFDKFSRR